MQLVTDNPNPLALTFNMEGINMGDFRKIVVPSKDHGIAEHVPIAQILLSQNDIFDRVELSNMNGQVSMTLCLLPSIAKGNPNFQLPDATKGQISVLVSEIQKHLVDTKQTPVHTCQSIRAYETAKSITLDDITKPDIRDVFEATLSVLNPMAAHHGGSFEVVGISKDESGPLKAYDVAPGMTVNETEFLSDDKQSIVFELAVFGSCSGCSSFFMTYGRSPKNIAAKLKDKNPSCPLQVRYITPSSRSALIFK